MKAERSCIAPELAFWKSAICERSIAHRSRAAGIKWHGNIDARAGVTGTGKSIIFGLLMRFRPVTGGTIRFESRDVATFSAR
jgi:ABC-type iron transport system FetAB ATPase subunit